MDDQATVEALIDPHRQRYRLAMPTGVTDLTREGRVHSHDLPPSFFRFGEQACEEHRPRGISDGFGQPGILDQIAHHQRFYCNEAKPLDQLADFLLDERLPPVGYPFMNACHHLAFLLSLPAPFWGLVRACAGHGPGLPLRRGKSGD